MTQILQAQDEVLQMMYWMRGEQLGTEVSPEQINRFLKVPAEELAEVIQRLVSRGLLARTGDSIQLTGSGIEEGKRRFLDEFTTILGKDTHLACSNPDCDCGREGFDGVCLSTG